ncbi:MAG: DUF559 domain-containing protein [Elusimicrobia bacterium]|nr:DUF559 domain-containing protein [Elusimicrobiota bacterium]
MSWIRKLRKIVKRHQESGFKAFRPEVKAQAIKRRGQLYFRRTKAEKEFAEILRKNGICYTRNKPISLDGSGTRYRMPDFYLPKKRVLIELDGGYHKAARVQAYDEMKDKAVGFRTFRYTNEEVFSNGEFIGAELKRLGF